MGCLYINALRTPAIPIYRAQQKWRFGSELAYRVIVYFCSSLGTYHLMTVVADADGGGFDAADAVADDD